MPGIPPPVLTPAKVIIFLLFVTETVKEHTRMTWMTGAPHHNPLFVQQH